MPIAIDNPSPNMINKDIHITSSSTQTRSSNNNKDDQITFINYAYNYCICIIDIVNSTKITQDLASQKKLGVIIPYS